MQVKPTYVDDLLKNIHPGDFSKKYRSMVGKTRRNYDELQVVKPIEEFTSENEIDEQKQKEQVNALLRGMTSKAP